MRILSNPYLFIFTLILGVALAMAVSVWATSIGTDISVDGQLTITGASTFTGAVTANGNVTLGNASTDINLFTGTLQASTTALFTTGLTTYGNSTFGDAAADINLFTGTLQASTTALFTGPLTSYGDSTFGANGTSFTSILHGFCNFGPILAAQSIAATSTGTVACTDQAPTGLAAGDKVWLTASTTKALVDGAGAGIVYTGIASSTSSGRIQAMLYNGTGVAWTVTTSTWQYFIIK